MELRRNRIAVGAVALAAAASVTLATAPSSLADDSGGGSGTAPTAASLITPLLNILNFGATIGLPLACNLGTSALLTGASQVNAGAAASPISNSINDQCNSLSTQGGTYIAQAIAQSQALTFIDPLLDPFIAGMATNLTSTGTNQAAAVAPFGPTISGLGGTVAFFEGS